MSAPSGKVFLVSDTLIETESGGFAWWEDDREVVALAAWAAHRGATAQDIISIYETPWENSILWDASQA